MGIDNDKFDRQKRISNWNQEKISNSKVLIVGAGALGNEVFKLLLQLGVGKISVIDFDEIVAANLNRCVFFSEQDLGKKKVEVLKEKAQTHSKTVDVEAIVKKVEDLDEKFFEKFDLAFSCLDNQDARLHLNAMCYGKLPLIDGGTFGFFGKVQVVSKDSSCLECSMSKRDYDLLWKKYSCVGEALSFADPKMPAISTTTSIIAALQANEFIKLSLEENNTLVGKYLQFNGLKNDYKVFDISKRKSCPIH